MNGCVSVSVRLCVFVGVYFNVPVCASGASHTPLAVSVFFWERLM